MYGIVLKFPKLNIVLVPLVLKHLSKYCLKYLYNSGGSQLYLMGLYMQVYTFLWAYCA